MRYIIIFFTFITSITVNNSAYAQSIESQYFLLFTSMEKRFENVKSDPVRSDKNGITTYKTNIGAIGTMKKSEGIIFQLDNGTIFYGNYFIEKKYDIINGLESYPSSRGYQVEVLSKTDKVFQYVVKNSVGKIIGFVKIRKHEEGGNKWAFNAQLAFDTKQFEKSIKSLCQHAIIGFDNINKVLTEETPKSKLYETDIKTKYAGKTFLLIPKDKSPQLFYLDYTMSAFEALKFQIQNLNLSFPNYERSIYINKENVFGYKFNSDDNIIKLLIEGENNPYTPSMTVARIPQTKLSLALNNSSTQEQLAFLFFEMENGFQNQMKNGEQQGSYTSYVTNLGTNFSEIGAIIKEKKGLVFFNSYIIENKDGVDQWKNKDQLIQAIEAYNSLKDFQVRPAFKDEGHVEYIVTKSNKTIGFIQMIKSSKGWKFLLFLPLDQQQLKTSIQNGLESAKDGFSSIQGKLLQTTSHGIKEHEATKKTYAALGAQIDHVLHNRAWLNKYQFYPFSALRHQILQMDLNVNGYSRSKEEKDNMLKLQFKQSSIELMLMVYSFEGIGSMLALNYSDETKKGKPITSLELNTTIVSHLEKGMDNINRVTGYIDQISERIALLEKNKEKMNMRSAQTMLRPAWQPFNMINSYLYDAENEISKALDLAHQVDCMDSKVAIDALYNRVGKTRSNFLDANKAFKVGTTTRGNDYIISQLDLASNKLQSGIREYNRISKEIDKINENPCYKTDLVNSSENKEKPKVKKEYHYVGLYIDDDEDIDFIKVTTVREGTAASKAGIQVGDIVLEVDGQSMEKLFGTFAQGYFKDQEKGKKIKVEIYSQQDDKIKIFNLETGKDGQFELIKEMPYTPIIKEIEFSEGDYYKGETRFGEPNGHGYYKFANGVFYEGEFSKGQLHGYGITTFPDGDFYEGNFINGRKEGIFIYKLEDKMYTFEYKNNEEQRRTLIEGEEKLAKIREEIKNSNKEKK